jgi:hypothetical protein
MSYQRFTAVDLYEIISTLVPLVRFSRIMAFCLVFLPTSSGVSNWRLGPGYQVMNEPLLETHFSISGCPTQIRSRGSR